MENLSWRDPCYAVSIEGMLATILEVNNHRRRSWSLPEPYPDFLRSSHSKTALLATSPSLPSVPPSSSQQVYKTRSSTPLTSSRRTSVSHIEVSGDDPTAAMVNWDVCPMLCGTTFKRGSDQRHNLKRHLKDQHQGAEVFECEDCERIFKNKWNRDRHTKIHRPKSVSSNDFLRPEDVRKECYTTKAQGLSRSRSQ